MARAARATYLPQPAPAGRALLGRTESEKGGSIPTRAKLWPLTARVIVEKYRNITIGYVLPCDREASPPVLNKKTGTIYVRFNVAYGAPAPREGVQS